MTFEASNSGLVDGDRDKDIRFADVIVVEEISSARFEIVNIERPAANGNGHAELVLFVALSMERSKGEAAQTVDFGEQRPGNGDERRSLVVASIVSAKNPVKIRHAHGSSESWVNRIFGDASREVSGPESADQREPRRHPEFIAQKERLQRAGRRFGIRYGIRRRRWSGRWVEEQAEEFTFLSANA